MRGFTAVGSDEVRITARGPVRSAGERMLGRLWIDQIPVRLASEDPTLWPSRPRQSAAAVCWPAQPGPARGLLGEIGALAEQARAARFTDVVLLGSGPPARAADVLARADVRDRTADGLRSRRASLSVLDGRDPGPLLRIGQDDERLLRTLMVVAADGPGPDALRRVFEQLLRDRGLSPTEIAQRFVVVAEPDGPLAALGRKAGHTVVAGSAGPVFGALSPAALVPAALAGVDVAELLDQAAAVLPSLTRPENNPGLVLGAILGGCARAGRDKLLVGDFPALVPGLGTWIAALLTTATGGGLFTAVQDGGLSVLPADDLFQVTIDGRPRQDDATVSGPLGAQLVVWEYAAAVTAYLLRADPFAATRATGSPANGGTGTGGAFGGGGAGRAADDAPAAVPGPSFTVGAATEVIEVYADEKVLPRTEDLAGVLDALVEAVPPDGHLTVLAYLDPDRAHGQGDGVRRLAALIAARCTRPVRIDWRPLYPVFANDVTEKGVFLILTGNVRHDAAVPDKRYRLSGLQLTEALGAVRALGERGRPAVRLHLQNRHTGIAQLLKAARGGA
jgi:glucose-6-phosphate isomerase